MNIYDRIGGAEGVRTLVVAFYVIVESEPEGAPLRVMHNRGNGFQHAREAQFLFLSGFLGGPRLMSGNSGIRTSNRFTTISRSARQRRNPGLPAWTRPLHG